MEIKLLLHNPNGGEMIPVVGEWTTSGITLNSVDGNSGVALAYAKLYNPKGGEPLWLAVTIHNDGTIEWGSITEPGPNLGVMNLVLPDGNSLETNVVLSSTGAATISSITVTGSGAPTYDSSYIADVPGTTKIVVRFSEKVASSNFATGVTIKKNTVAQNILSAALQANGVQVIYTLDAAADGNDVLTWEYDSGTGDIADQTDGTVLASVTAKTVTNNIADVLPEFSSAEIGAVLDTTVVMVLSKDVVAAGNDYTTGITIEVNSAPVVIASGTRQASHDTIYYVIPAVDADDIVTIEYDDTTGVILAEDDGSALATFAAESVTNTVAGVAPTLTSAEVGTVNATTVVAVFSVDVKAAGDAFETGITINVAGAPVAISASAQQASHDTIYYTIPAVVNGQVVTMDYDDTTGLIQNEDDSEPLASFTAEAVTNNVA